MSCKQGSRESYSKTVSVEVVNPLNESRKDVLVYVSLGDTADVGSVMVRSNEVQLATQLEDSSLWIYLDSMKANEKRTITIYYSTNPMVETARYRKRTQAVSLDDKSFGWESEKIGYLFHNDGVEVLGKKTSDMVLMGIRPDETEFYQTNVAGSARPYRFGSIGYWNDSVVVKLTHPNNTQPEIHDGELYSSVVTKFLERPAHDTIDIVARYSIQAGSRLTSYSITAPIHISTYD
ncbi:MAG: DUF4861 family protein [Bacteroidota bacterium]